MLNNLNYNYQNDKVLNSIKINNQNSYESNVVNGFHDDFNNDKIKIRDWSELISSENGNKIKFVKNRCEKLF